MVEEAGEADSVVCEMWLLADNDDVVLASSGIELQEFLAGVL
jgi:hypothetical protein